MLQPLRPLSIVNHARDAAGLTYVYPVLSRRAGGISVGINLNPNRACNWHCVYCQVPGLMRGPGPTIDLPKLERELTDLLKAITQGDWLEQAGAPAAAGLRDVALAGDGEPTTSPQFCEAVHTVGSVLGQLDLAGKLPLVLITNGSMLHREAVRAGVRELARLGGEIWFKLDNATTEGILRFNGAHLSMAERRQKLARAVELGPTWVQTCLFQWDGQPPSMAEQRAYLACMRELQAQKLGLAGILLYTVARPSAQSEGDRVAPLSEAWLRAFADQLEAIGYTVRVNAA